MGGRERPVRHAAYGRQAAPNLAATRRNESPEDEKSGRQEFLSAKSVNPLFQGEFSLTMQQLPKLRVAASSPVSRSGIFELGRSLTSLDPSSFPEFRGHLRGGVGYLAGRPTDLLRGSAAASPGARIALANGITRSPSSSATPVWRTTVGFAPDNRRRLEPVHTACLPTLPLEISITTLRQGLSRKRMEIHAVEVCVARAEIRIDFICVRGRPVREYIWEG